MAPPQRPSGQIRPPHPTASTIGRSIGAQRRSRGEGSSLSGLATSDEVLTAEQVPGGTDTDGAHDDASFDLGAEIRC